MIIYLISVLLLVKWKLIKSVVSYSISTFACNLISFEAAPTIT